VSKNSLEKLGKPNFSELEFLRTEMENFGSWKKFGKNREIAWQFSLATDFSVKCLLYSFPIRSVGKFRPKSLRARNSIKITF